MDAVHHLSIDIETYSDQEIGKTGLYRYAQSPVFAILLLAYSLDGAPVQVVDLTQPGARLPAEVVRCCSTLPVSSTPTTPPLSGTV